MPSPEMGLSECLTRIIALCENPHWTADRKDRIVELARQAMLGKSIHDIIERRPGQTLDVKIIYPDRVVTLEIDVAKTGWRIDHSEPANGGDIDKTLYQESLIDGSWEPSVPFLE